MVTLAIGALTGMPIEQTAHGAQHGTDNMRFVRIGHGVGAEFHGIELGPQRHQSVSEPVDPWRRVGDRAGSAHYGDPSPIFLPAGHYFSCRKCS
jgi:hypothetical protein